MLSPLTDGSGTVLASLGFGIPQLCVPQAADQFGNAAAIAKARAGIAVHPHEADPATIADAVSQLLNEPDYRETAASLPTRSPPCHHPTRSQHYSNQSPEQRHDSSRRAPHRISNIGERYAVSVRPPAVLRLLQFGPRPPGGGSAARGGVKIDQGPGSRSKGTK